ncbi:MAG: hypothetical protein MUE50_00345 [Pirellulaceae bacterium]|jgi:hypothetical protein|nr:hypothetical protein [Pirellulaceae bacterium]MCU0980767.1 hypothetical protein [Pirellulaceae bacterium]
MLDSHDREKFATIYRLLADVLEHEAQADRSDDAMSYRLGDLAARVFIGAPPEPPDEVLESAANVLRTGGSEDRQQLAVRLRAHAEQLERVPGGG